MGRVGVGASVFVSTAGICPVSTEDICPVLSDDWLLWGQLGGSENDFNIFFTPKMRKMEHAGGGPGEHGEHGAPEMQPHAAARGQVLHAPGARIT